LILCVYLFIRKGRGSICALVCAAIPLLSVLLHYATEARGYSLMTGFAALAMLSYQHACKTTWCLLLGVSLVAATASHYYAVFVSFPFILAELAILAKERRLRLGVWLALLVSVLPVAVFWHLLQNYKNIYASHFVGHLSPLEVVRSYAFLWDLPTSLGVGLATTALAAILLFGLFRHKDFAPNSTEEIALQEHVLALGFIVLPVAMGLVFKVVHGGFLPRYMISAVLGFPLAASYVFSVLDRRVAGVFSILLLATLSAQEAWFWHGKLHSFKSEVNTAKGFERLLKSAGYEDLPVVVSGPNNYLQLAYYASSETRSRMFFAADPTAAISYVGSDNADQLLLRLRPYLAVQVDDFANFVRIHSEFLIYSDSSDVWDWLPIQMLRDGYALDLLAMDHDQRVYFVHRKVSVK